MSSYSNFYNSYRYGNNNNNEQNSGNNFAGNRQPLQPPQGYMEASYSWNNQGATSGLDNQQVQNSKAYSNNNDVYSRSQDNSSSFGQLPTALGGYNQGVQAGENTQRSQGLNSLVYASSLESAYLKNPTTSQPSKPAAQGSRGSSQYPNTTASYSYQPQSSTAANSRSNYNQQPQRTFSAASLTTAPSYTSTSYDTTRQYQTQPPHLSQPERRPSPKVKPQAKAPRRVSNYKSPPTSQPSTKTSLHAPSYSQQSHQYSSYAANTSSVTSHQHPVASQGPTTAGISRAQTPPTMTSQNRVSDQASPAKPQYINPSDLFTQQYFLAQERVRAAEAEAVAEENQRKEAEAQAEAEALAKLAEVTAATENTTATPTSAGKGKATKPKPAKNSAKKRSSAKKKAVDKNPTTADVPEEEDDMAEQMRLMLEKLRGMRSKDPSMFSKLWDDFKKAPAINQTAATPPAPSSGPAAGTSKQTPIGQPATGGTPDTGKGLIDGLPDLGKFPAQRRNRKRKSDISKVPPKPQSDIPAPAAQVNVDSMLNQQPQSLPPPTTFNAQRATSDSTPNSTVAQAKQNTASGATKQSQPKTNPGQNATWPAATQQKLAQAASEYLGKDPANKGRECSAESLMLLLRNNPTYPDLCSLLESRGFALDRQAMARFLLAAVPTLVSGNGQKAEATNNASQVAQSLPQLSPVTDPSSLPQPVSSFNVAPQAHAPRPISQAPQMLELNLNNGVAATVPLPAQKKDKNKSLQRPRKPGGQFASIPVIGPKAEMARKKLFSEIVDMTQLSSDEDEDMLSDNEDSFHGNSSHFGPPVGVQPRFPGLGQDSMDLDTDSPQPTEHDLSDSRSAMAQPDIDIDFDPDDEFVLEEIKKLPNIAKPVNPLAALHRVYYNPKSIARDIMLATGRHPSDRPLNYHLMRFTQTFTGVSTKSDFETFRWDVVDPGGPSMPVVELEDIVVEPQITRKRKRRHDQSRDGADASGPTSDGQVQVQPQPAPGAALPAVVSTPQPVRDSAMAATPTSGAKTGRRGRPPGAKNKKPTKAALKATGTAVASSSSTKNVRIAGSEPTPTVPEPSYPVFTCEWASCPAQLHDVHTLERHVNKVHLPGQKTCQWHSCPNSTTEYNDEALKEHLEKAHIQPLAWKYGDGPSVNGTDFKIDRYLNTNGVMITPDAATAGEADALIFPLEPTSIRAFSKLYGDQKPAQQVLRAIQKRRKHVGIGLEQEGCEFSNPVRNKHFANDEEWYEVVPDEEDGVDSWFAQEEVS